MSITLRGMQNKPAAHSTTGSNERVAIPGGDRDEGQPGRQALLRPASVALLGKLLGIFLLIKLRSALSPSHSTSTCVFERNENVAQLL